MKQKHLRPKKKSGDDLQTYFSATFAARVQGHFLKKKISIMQLILVDNFEKWSSHHSILVANTSPFTGIADPTMRIGQEES